MTSFSKFSTKMKDLNMSNLTDLTPEVKQLIKQFQTAAFEAGAKAFRDMVLDEINSRDEDNFAYYAEAPEMDEAIRDLPLPSFKEQTGD